MQTADLGALHAQELHELQHLVVRDRPGLLGGEVGAVHVLVEAARGDAAAVELDEQAQVREPERLHGLLEGVGGLGRDLAADARDLAQLVGALLVVALLRQAQGLIGVVVREGDDALERHDRAEVIRVFLVCFACLGHAELFKVSTADIDEPVAAHVDDLLVVGDHAALGHVEHEAQEDDLLLHLVDELEVVHRLLEGRLGLAAPVLALPERGRLLDGLGVLGVDAVDAQAVALLLLEGALDVGLLGALDVLEALAHPRLVLGISLRAQEVAGLGADDELVIPDDRGHIRQNMLEGAAGAQVLVLVPVLLHVLRVKAAALGVDVGLLREQFMVALLDTGGARRTVDLAVDELLVCHFVLLFVV